MPEEKSPTIVINEIAYRGTVASGNDEWIELHNADENPLDLTGWELRINARSIQLSGKIPSRGFFLLERTDDTTIGDIPADLIYTGAMKDNNTTISLIDPAGNTVDQVTEWFVDLGAPPDGASPRSSMERISALKKGSDEENWRINDQKTRNGIDAKKNPIIGTPRHKNSAQQDKSVPGQMRVERSEANSPLQRAEAKDSEAEISEEIIGRGERRPFSGHTYSQQIPGSARIEVEAASRLPARVTKVIDGDTIDIEFEDSVKPTRLRLIGVDAPESKHPLKHEEFFGREAAEFTRHSLLDHDIQIEFDPDHQKTYGRELAYVYVDGELFNETLIVQGYAKAYLKYPFRYQEAFRKLEAEARTTGKGLWAAMKIQTNENSESSIGSVAPFDEKTQDQKTLMASVLGENHPAKSSDATIIPAISPNHPTFIPISAPFFIISSIIILASILLFFTAYRYLLSPRGRSEGVGSSS